MPVIKKCLDCDDVLDEPKRKRCYSCAMIRANSANKRPEISKTLYRFAERTKFWSNANEHITKMAKKAGRAALARAERQHAADRYFN